jgi:hypothetical protein
MKTKLGGFFVEHDNIHTNNNTKNKVGILDMVCQFDCVSNLQHIWIIENGLFSSEGWHPFAQIVFFQKYNMKTLYGNCYERIISTLLSQV